MSAYSDEDELMRLAIEQSLQDAGLSPRGFQGVQDYQVPQIPQFPPPRTEIKTTNPTLPYIGNFQMPYQTPQIPPMPEIPQIPKPNTFISPYIPPGFQAPQLPQIPQLPPAPPSPWVAPVVRPSSPKSPKSGSSPLPPLPAWQSPNLPPVPPSPWVAPVIPPIPNIPGPSSPLGAFGGASDIDLAMAELADAREEYERALKRLSEASTRYDELLRKEKEIDANRTLVQQQNMEYEVALQQDQAQKQGFVIPTSPRTSPRSTPSGKQGISGSPSPLSSPSPRLTPPASEDDSYMVKLIYPDRSVETIATTGDQTVGGLQRYASKKFKKPIVVFKTIGQTFTPETTLRELGSKKGMVFRFNLP